LKLQAKDLLRAGAAATLAEAQRTVARQYGFASWPRLKAHVEMLRDAGKLKQAIDENDLAAVQALMTHNPALHRAPLGYRQSGPLTWAAECRGQASPPEAARLRMAAWMIEAGSDVHQGGDAPLMRAALSGQRTAMMALLVERGADVNAALGGDFPILFSPCETVDPVALRWLLEHGADPNCGGRRCGPALDYLLGSYVRSPLLRECIDLLLAAGGATTLAEPAVLAVIRGDIETLAALLAADPALGHRRVGALTVGTTGSRRLTLRGGTLLHVAAEYGRVEAAALLLDRGADVDARGAVDDAGVGGQTALFHAVTQFRDAGLPVARLLLARGADVAVRATLPGHYERPAETVVCTALGYARLFPEGGGNGAVALLQAHGAAE
jgi:hypothetical protein